MGTSMLMMMTGVQCENTPKINEKKKTFAEYFACMCVSIKPLSFSYVYGGYIMVLAICFILMFMCIVSWLWLGYTKKIYVSNAAIMLCILNTYTILSYKHTRTFDVAYNVIYIWLISQFANINIGSRLHIRILREYLHTHTHTHTHIRIESQTHWDHVFVMCLHTICN